MSQDDRSNVERIVTILKCFSAENTPQRTHEILSRLNIARSTGFGLLRALVASGWLERFDHGLLCLGPKARELIFAPLEPQKFKNQDRISASPYRAAGCEPRSNKNLDLKWNPALVSMVDGKKFRLPGPYRIGFSNASTSNAWRRAMLQSLYYAHKIAHTQISQLLVMDAEDDAKMQCQHIDDLVAKGIDLLLISITSVADTAISDRLRALAAAGLPIVAVDRRPNDRSSLVSFVTASDHRIGGTSALWMAERLSGKGRVWMLSGKEGTSPALRRQKAALSMFAEFPGIRVENVSYTDWTEAGGAAAISHLLSEAGYSPDGVWCDSGLQGIGSVREFLDRDLCVPVHTGGDLNAMYKQCLIHKIPIVALDYPASMGARALELALEILHGGTVPQRVEVPVQIVLPRGCETSSVKADTWAELHVAWDLEDDAILSQGPALQGARSSAKGKLTG